MSESFGEAMQRLQTEAGCTSKHLQEISQGILDLAKNVPTNANPRDTQFAGFANALYSEMCAYLADATIAGTEDGNSAPYVQIIARRAYDLVSHTLLSTGPMMIDCFSHEEQIAEIPDLTAWPEVNE